LLFIHEERAALRRAWYAELISGLHERLLIFIIELNGHFVGLTGVSDLMAFHPAVTRGKLEDLT